MLESGARNVAYRYAAIRDGVEYVPLRCSGTPSIRMAADGEIKMTFSGVFRKDSRVDWLADRVRPYMILDGIEYPLGEYAVPTVGENEQYGEPYQTVTGYDAVYYAQRSRIEHKESFKAGERYTDIIKGQLIAAGIEKIICEDSPEVLQTDREDWEIGESRLTIANALAREINYRSMYADFNGNVHISPYIPPSGAVIGHVYEDGRDSVFLPELSIGTDAFSLCNVFLAYVSSPDYGECMRALAENEELIQKTGMRIMAPPEKLDNIASSQALQEFADRMRDQGRITQEEVTFQTLNLPTHGVGDVLSLKKGAIDGIYLEQEWSMALSYDGVMDHKARRVWL